MNKSETRTASFCDTDLNALKNWTPEERKDLCLTVWVDSKFMTIALCPAKEPRKTIYMQRIAVTKREEVLNNFEMLRNAFGSNECQVAYSTMSFAGPVSSDNVVVTNWKCEARERVIHFTSLPFDLFPLDRRRFMNDLEAASYGIIARNLRNNLHLIFKPLWKIYEDEDEHIHLDGSSLVLSIGSGFGTSYICRADSSENNCVVSSEAGHSQAYQCSYEDPQYELEQKLFKYCTEKVHASSHQPEWEDFCAIRGVEMIYTFLKKEKGEIIDPRHADYELIRQLAFSGRDPDALEAFRIQYRFVIRAAQSLVLAIKCQRVFIISEYQVKCYPLMERFAADIRNEFENHPRRTWLNDVHVYVQESTSTFALSGGLFLSRVFAVAQSKQAHSV